MDRRRGGGSALLMEVRCHQAKRHSLSCVGCSNAGGWRWRRDLQSQGGCAGAVRVLKRNWPPPSPYSLVHNPLPSNPSVRIQPSLTMKMPGNLVSHPAFAAGTYWRALASTALVPGTCAAMPTECTSAAPGQVRSCTQRNILYFCAAAAMSSDPDCPLHAFSATDSRDRCSWQRSGLSLARLQRHGRIVHLARQEQRIEAGERFVDHYRTKFRRLEHEIGRAHV